MKMFNFFAVSLLALSCIPSFAHDDIDPLAALSPRDAAYRNHLQKNLGLQRVSIYKDEDSTQSKYVLELKLNSMECKIEMIQGHLYNDDNTYIEGKISSAWHFGSFKTTGNITAGSSFMSIQLGNNSSITATINSLPADIAAFADNVIEPQKSSAYLDLKDNKFEVADAAAAILKNNFVDKNGHDSLDEMAKTCMKLFTK